MKMKKSLLALAALGSFAGVASAQSSVTLFGIIDESVNALKTGGVTKYTMSPNQLSYDRLGFRGTEDLGDGLRAGFWLEAGMDPSQGAVGGGNGIPGSQGTTGGQAFFNRRSTVSLSNRYGEIRAGRDFDPSFWNYVYFDVYGASGVGCGLNLISALGSGAQTVAYVNNAVSYFLPSGLGGVYGQVTVAAGENVSGQKYSGGRLGYATGPFDVAVAISDTKTPSGNDLKVGNAGASYDFNVAKVYGFYNESKFADTKLTTAEISVGVPLGFGQVNAGYAHAKASGVTLAGVNTEGNGADEISLQYVYNLSKRTSLYTGGAHIKNRGNATFSVNAGDSPLPGQIGANSSGYNVGIRHTF